MTIRNVALFAGVLMFSGLSAQVGVGGKVGANFSVGSQKIQPDPKNPPTNPKGLGMQFGAFLAIPFSDMVGIRPELGFSFRRMRTESTVNESYNNAQVVFNTDQGQQQGTFTGNQEERTEVDQRLSYFQVVTPITLTPTEGLRVMLGPSFNFLMGGKQNTDVTITTKGTATVAGQNQNIDDEDFQSSKKKGSGAIKDFRKADIGALAGIGYTLPVGLDLDLRYTRSLSTTYDETQGKLRHRIWTNLIEFSIGWQFGG